MLAAGKVTGDTWLLMPENVEQLSYKHFFWVPGDGYNDII